MRDGIGWCFTGLSKIDFDCIQSKVVVLYQVTLEHCEWFAKLCTYTNENTKAIIILAKSR